jgi:hypothetical protein
MMLYFARIAQVGFSLLFAGLVLSACGAPQPAAPATVTLLVSPLKAIGIVASTITPAPTLRPTAKPLPTMLPTLDPVNVSRQISESIRLETSVGVNSSSDQRVTGWSYGWRLSNYCTDGPYRWLDNEHLLLYPVTGEEEMMGLAEYALPFVLSLDDGQTWQPASNGPTYECDRPLWSDYLQLLIAADEQQTALYTSKGVIYRLYNSGNALWNRTYLSPSGRKALIGSSWLDLETGQTVDIGDDWGRKAYDPAWSSDETRLFECCFRYADARQGGAKQLHLSPLLPVGRGGPGPGERRILSRFVLSDTHVMVRYQFMEGEQIGVVPLIDPVAGTYEDIRTLVGFGKDVRCGGSPLDDGEHLALSCGKNDSYLVDLRSFITTTLPASTRPAAMTSTMSRDNQQWAWLSSEGRVLNVEDLSTQSTLQLTLTQPATQVVWHPNNVSLVAVGTDGTLWWIADPAIDRIEQLTTPLPEVRDVKWSPNGDKLAFVSGSDVYVVTVSK